jgi:transposase-like protein
MPHHNQSIRERVIALVEEGNLTAAEAGRRYGVPDRTAKRWIERHRELGKLVGALVRDFGVCHPKLRTPGWWTRHGKIHFSIPSS